MNPLLSNENLRREIGVRALTLTIINGTVGAGIFVIPAIVYENLGAAAIIAYLVCGALIFLIALCFAELGSKTTVSGGIYTYIEDAFGPFAGFIANNLFWLSGVFSDAAVANALADTLKYFFPSLDKEIFRILFFIFIFAGIAIVNIRSVKQGVRFVEFATLAKLVPLVLLVIAGIGFVSANNLRWASVPTISSIGATTLLLIFAFSGVEGPVTNGGEIKNVNRTVPLAIFFGIASILILYISIQLVTQGILGNNILAHKDSPLVATAGIIFGTAGIILMITGSAISMLGCIGGTILAFPRMLYAGARDGLMPKALGKVHPRFLTPHIAVAFYASMDFVFAVSGGFKQLAIISGATTLLIYFGVVLAVIKLRKKSLITAQKTFRIPGGIIIPLLAAVAIIWLLCNLTLPEFISIIIFIFIFSLIYLSIKVLKKKTAKSERKRSNG